MNLTDSAKRWLAEGEHGASSKTMFSVLSGLDISRFNDHPYDPDDFRRCYLLINQVPEFEKDLYKVAELSPVWKNIIDNWGKLTTMLLEQMATRKANGMYEFMKTLGC